MIKLEETNKPEEKGGPYSIGSEPLRCIIDKVSGKSLHIRRIVAIDNRLKKKWVGPPPSSYSEDGGRFEEVGREVVVFLAENPDTVHLHGTSLVAPALELIQKNSRTWPPRGTGHFKPEPEDTHTTIHLDGGKVISLGEEDFKQFHENPNLCYDARHGKIIEHELIE